MRAELKNIDDCNIEACKSLKVSKKQERYICSNADSLKDANENATVARPFAIYIKHELVGFTMFAFDEDYDDPNDRYWLWRFMIDEKQQGKGYGTLALQAIIEYFKNNRATYIKLSTKETNSTALSLYHKFGFKENGEMNNEKIVLELSW